MKDLDEQALLHALVIVRAFLAVLIISGMLGAIKGNVDVDLMLKARE